MRAVPPGVVVTARKNSSKPQNAPSGPPQAGGETSVKAESARKTGPKALEKKGAGRKAAAKGRKVLSKVEEAKAEMYRGLIFEAAEQAFGERGFAETTMQEIASATGVSVKTLYASFPGKQELYDEIMLEHAREMIETVSAAQDAEIEPVEKLAAGLHAFVGFFFDHTSWTKMHAISRASWAQKPADARHLQLWEKSQSADCKILRKGIEAGVFYDEDPEEVARLIRAMVRVQAVHAFEVGDKTVQEVAESVTRRVMRMVCRNPKDASVERAD